MPDPDVGSSALVLSPDMTPFLIRTTLDESLEAGAITQDEADTQWAVVNEAPVVESRLVPEAALPS